jgi:Lysylphosphatidylglycerol synthase TM region
MRRNVWWWAISCLLADALLYVSVRGVNWGRVLRTIAAARWRYVAAAVAITTCSYFWRSLRWRILLNASASFSVADADSGRCRSLFRREADHFSAILGMVIGIVGIILCGASGHSWGQNPLRSGGAVHFAVLELHIIMTS